MCHSVAKHFWIFFPCRESPSSNKDGRWTWIQHVLCLFSRGWCCLLFACEVAVHILASFTLQTNVAAGRQEMEEQASAQVNKMSFPVQLVYSLHVYGVLGKHWAMDKMLCFVVVYCTVCPSSVSCIVSSCSDQLPWTESSYYTLAKCVIISHLLCL